MSDLTDNKAIDLETQEMLRSFVSEAFDSLDTNEPLVEYLRQDNNAEYVNAIFRVFHTLKGLSGFFEMHVIHKVTHEAETLLDIIRKQNGVQTEETISVIYSTFDFLRELLQRVSADYSDKSGEDDADDMKIIIQDAISKVSGNVPSVDEFLSEDDYFDSPAQTTKTISEEDNYDAPEEVIESTTSAEYLVEEEIAPVGDDSLISDEMLDQYISGAKELLELVENNLITLEKSPDNLAIIQETFGAVHSLKGNSGFMGFSEIEEISMDMETILDSLRSKELDADQTVISILLSNLEMVQDRITKIEIENNKKSAKPAPVVAKPEPAKVEVKEKIVEKIEKSTPIIEPPVAKEPEIESVIESKPIVSTPKAVPTPRAEPSKIGQNFNQMQKKDIRVETSKIDKLFDLVGELITIESMVTNNPDLKGLNLPSFNKSASMLNKITRELQEITMSVRMMPLEGLFNKMKRLVRDVSLKMEKKIDLAVSGQETEMDKNVIDEIADPLVHILRNAIDHGVESPQKRLEKGKPEMGNISLSARYEGNEILIEIKDDGNGIHREVILRKAEEKGLLTKSPDLMSDKEVFMLIFEPGFSTAAKVTDISGRGVGMDVVKKNIEKLRGSIEIESVPSKGSTFTLRIPLTLAIMESMVIRVGNARYALPILSVTESFKVNMKNISKTMDGLEVVRIRDEVLPIIRLHEIFSKKPDNPNLENGILIIIESRRKKVCLFVDEIVGQQQAVIKSLTDYIGKVSGIMGCMILGDGGIGLIMDIESLIELSEITGNRYYQNFKSA